jgi:hypothetical protein
MRLVRRGASLATLAVVAFVGSPAARAQGLASEDLVTLRVLVYDYVNVPAGTLRNAEREANRVLAAAGARIDWVHCMDTTRLASEAKSWCDDRWTPQTPAVRFIAGGNRLQPRQYAYTAIPVLITVYYEKVANVAHRSYGPAETPVLLGNVIAHELGHLLLGTQTHSKSGIMQAEFGERQIHDALVGHLGFTKDQGTRIQSQARLLASRPARSTPTP